MDSPSFQHLIDGRLVDAGTGRWRDVHEPATGRVYARCADGDGGDIDRAVTAASAAAQRA